MFTAVLLFFSFLPIMFVCFVHTCLIHLFLNAIAFKSPISLQVKNSSVHRFERKSFLDVDHTSHVHCCTNDIQLKQMFVPIRIGQWLSICLLCFQFLLFFYSLRHLLFKIVLRVQLLLPSDLLFRLLILLLPLYKNRLVDWEFNRE